MWNQNNTPKPGKSRKRRRKKIIASNLVWTKLSKPQIPSETFTSFEESKDILSQSINTVEKSVISKPEMHNISLNYMNQPSFSGKSIPLLQRIDTKAKIKGKVTDNQRNIHVLTAHGPGPSIPVQSFEPPAMAETSFLSRHRPKGVPLSFLCHQEFQGAITPQQGTNDQHKIIPGQMNTYELYNQQTFQNETTLNQPRQMQQPNQMYGYPVQMVQTMQMYGQQMINEQHGQQVHVQQHIPTQLFSEQQNMLSQQQMFYQYAMPGPQITPNATQVYNPQVATHDNSPRPLQEQYSPTEIYDDNNDSKSDYASSDSSDVLGNRQKRQSAFERLGPQTKRSKPKLTINLCLHKDQPVREVIEETKQVPVYERDDVMKSTDPTVVKFRYLWPWKNNIPFKRSVTARSSRTVMMLEREQVEEEYKNDNLFMIVSVEGYPPTWSKEDVIDAILEDLKEKSFIPCFIEFNSKCCKFLVNRCRSALLALHYKGFSVRKDDVELMITISVTILNTRALEYIPRLVIRGRLGLCCDGEKADLSKFTLESDISNFIYFPLNHPTNQSELMELVLGCDWKHLNEMDLSHNRLTSIGDFDLVSKLPNLRRLDLSYNLLDDYKAVLPLRGLMLQSLSLEGNPLCVNYVDGDYYVKVFKTMFPCLRQLDGVPIVTAGQLPELKQHYCFKDAQPLVEKFVAYFFRFLDLEPDKRHSIVDMYDKDAMFTVTSKKALRYDQQYSPVRQLFMRSRCIAEGNYDYVHGSEKIGKFINKWPHLRHDTHSFNIDVLIHTETKTLLRINGIVSTRAASLAEEEKLFAFARTVLLVCDDGVEYKINNEMLFWDEPTKQCAANAFKYALVQNKTASWKFEQPLDEESKNSLINIFSKLTGLNSHKSSRCLEEKDWDLKLAIEYFMKLLKLDNIESLLK